VVKGDSNSHGSEEETSKTPSVTLNNNSKHTKASVKIRDPEILLFVLFVPPKPPWWNQDIKESQQVHKLWCQGIFL